MQSHNMTPLNRSSSPTCASPGPGSSASPPRPPLQVYPHLCPHPPLQPSNGIISPSRDNRLTTPSNLNSLSYVNRTSARNHKSQTRVGSRSSWGGVNALDKSCTTLTSGNGSMDAAHLVTRALPTGTPASRKTLPAALSEIDTTEIGDMVRVVKPNSDPKPSSTHLANGTEVITPSQTSPHFQPFLKQSSSELNGIHQQHCHEPSYSAHSYSQSHSIEPVSPTASVSWAYASSRTQTDLQTISSHEKRKTFSSGQSRVRPMITVSDEKGQVNSFVSTNASNLTKMQPQREHPNLNTSPTQLPIPLSSTQHATSHHSKSLSHSSFIYSHSRSASASSLSPHVVADPAHIPPDLSLDALPVFVARGSDLSNHSQTNVMTASATVTATTTNAHYAVSAPMSVMADTSRIPNIPENGDTNSDSTARAQNQTLGLIPCASSSMTTCLEPTLTDGINLTVNSPLATRMPSSALSIDAQDPLLFVPNLLLPPHSNTVYPANQCTTPSTAATASASASHAHGYDNQLNSKHEQAHYHNLRSFNNLSANSTPTEKQLHDFTSHLTSSDGDAAIQGDCVNTTSNKQAPSGSEPTTDGMLPSFAVTFPFPSSSILFLLFALGLFVFALGLISWPLPWTTVTAQVTLPQMASLTISAQVFLYRFVQDGLLYQPTNSPYIFVGDSQSYGFHAHASESRWIEQCYEKQTDAPGLLTVALILNLFYLCGVFLYYKNHSREDSPFNFRFFASLTVFLFCSSLFFVLSFVTWTCGCHAALSSYYPQVTYPDERSSMTGPPSFLIHTDVKFTSGFALTLVCFLLSTLMFFIHGLTCFRIWSKRKDKVQAHRLHLKHNHRPEGNAHFVDPTSMV